MVRMRTTLQIKGMHCASCEALVTDIVADQGAKVVSADFRSGKVDIDYDPKRAPLEKIKKAIVAEGDNYRVE